jgi:hypothetical protein
MSYPYVYFMQVVGGGPIKIGCSVEPKNRLVSMMSWCPYPLELITQVDGCEVAEASLHRKFAAHRMQSEWFAPAQELVEFIERVKQAGELPPDIASRENTELWGHLQHQSCLGVVFKRHGIRYADVAAAIGVTAQTMPNYAYYLPPHRAVQVAEYLTSIGIPTAPKDLYGERPPPLKRGRLGPKPRKNKAPAVPA